MREHGQGLALARADVKTRRGGPAGPALQTPASSCWGLGPADAALRYGGGDGLGASKTGALWLCTPVCVVAACRAVRRVK